MAGLLAPLNMVLIKGGTFMMGSKDGSEDEKPVHQVTVSSFYMDKTEVTQEDFKRLMGVNPSRFKDCPQCPVENVSWYDAVLYANARTKAGGSNDTVYSYTEKTGMPGNNCILKNVGIDYRRKGFRLPTEAEWEYACRAGTTTPFSFGSYISSDQVNFYGKYPFSDGKKGIYRKKTVEVRSLPPNGWGLYEMHGNVWEWCNDRYNNSYHSTGSMQNPVGPQGGEDRVLRGGSWRNFARFCRSANRYYFVPGLRDLNFGFRLSRGQ